MMLLAWTILAILIVIGLYVFAVAAIVKFSLSPIRIPIYLSPGTLGCPQEHVNISSRLGGTIPAWWVDGSSNVVAVLLHGYIMNRCELVPTASWLHQRGIGSVLPDFGGHGTASRNATTIGWDERLEVLSVIDEIRRRKPDAQVVLIGSSMGSAAAAFALGDEPECAQALVLDSAYCHLSVAIGRWWHLFGPQWLGKLMWPAAHLSGWMTGLNPKKVVVAEALQRSTCPVLVLHGDRDGIALVSEARVNIEALGSRAKVHWFQGCRHSEGRWELPDEYFGALEEFLVATDFLHRPKIETVVAQASSNSPS